LLYLENLKAEGIASWICRFLLLASRTKPKDNSQAYSENETLVLFCAFEYGGKKAPERAHSLRSSIAGSTTSRICRLKRGRNWNNRLDHEVSLVQRRRRRTAPQPVDSESGHQDLRGDDRM
jgi:hypothetical protein